MLRTLIVDDERLAREELKYVLKEYKGIELVGEASHGREALELYNSLRPDLIFLDINMPGINGVDVAERLLEMESPPIIVFVTAYDEYAIKAFEISAVDYILKPLSEERFKITMEKIEGQVKEENYLEKIKNMLENLKTPGEIVQERRNRVSLMDGDKLIPVELDHIIYITIENKNTVVVTRKGKYNIGNTLNELEDRWGDRFFRSHKSFLINLDLVEEIEPWFNSTYNLKLKGSQENIPVSRSQVKTFREKMNIV